MSSCGKGEGLSGVSASGEMLVAETDETAQSQYSDGAALETAEAVAADDCQH